MVSIGEHFAKSSFCIRHIEPQIQDSLSTRLIMQSANFVLDSELVIYFKFIHRPVFPFLSCIVFHVPRQEKLLTYCKPKCFKDFKLMLRLSLLSEAEHLRIVLHSLYYIVPKLAI